MLLTMSLAAFSQTGTNKNNLVCFPDSTAKKVAIDLVRGDSARAELIKTKQLVIKLEDKNAVNERLINSYVNKCANYTEQITLYRQKESKFTEIISGLESDVKQLKKKNKFFRYVTIGLGTTTAALIVTTFIN